MVGLRQVALGLAVGTLLGAIWLAPGIGIGAPYLFRQTGHSMPVGYWVYDHAVPAKVGEVVVERDPKDFTLPYLMKRIAGTAGALFCWRPELGTHTLDGRVMPPPSPKAAALNIKPWAGCRRLQPGELVGYGDSPDSFDSRYRGPVHERRMWGVYRPLWVS